MNKTMRRIGGVFLSAVFAGGALAACGSDDEENAGSEQVAAAEDDRSVEERFEWQARAADPNGILIFQPKASESKGQILSTETRSYEPGSEEAKNSKPEGVVFQMVDFTGAAPIPFSESDGPTGFDGMVPTGYTQSAAGAALAAEAYTGAALSSVYPEFLEKVSVGTTDEMRNEAKKNADFVAQSKDIQTAHKAGHYPASEGAKVEMIRPDYARVSVYSRGTKEDGTPGFISTSRDLVWVGGLWKMSFDSQPSVAETDEFPKEGWSWIQE
ncbi:hypothetical protein [Corynebacterium suicordis]|uniref:DUF8175 domain-containing protein n=1 Tax=Corynebacterium suicordis DSM 45110 TaxID=1121369 RepID=A0ABR9ZN58_9CORY|nr:hypothetical protein [Corynebacterium suicordis]MBF4554379.1 hypothetical protein [Corynebacterium suicordis DSM 45110]MDR6278597.1 hypothetical protein [Corynebacterium suicordis]